jgi:glycine/D-amino acid oxidase-like deaminating enzyme/nitrite reductase/ring-hydroxylating ferredoxin subunit
MPGSAPTTGDSYWVSSTGDADARVMEDDLYASVVVVGGGIVGLTTALLLKRAGFTVAVLEAGAVAAGVSGHTTGKLTAGHGIVYSRVERRLGSRHARLYAESQTAALELVFRLADELGIDCDLERAPNYVFAEEEHEVELLSVEASAARRAGLDARVTHDADVPFPMRAALRLEAQGQFHPRKYLIGLARAVQGDGASVFQGVRALRIQEGSVFHVETTRGTVLARHVVLATHVPITMKGWFFARVHPWRGYAVAAPVRDGTLDGMWINVGSPTRSLRTVPVEEGGRLILVVGQGHRAGQDGDTRERYGALEAYLHQHFPGSEIRYRWSTQDAYSVDGLPFVGRAGGSDSRLLVATGFGGWGMTGGTLAGMLLADLIQGRSSEWARLYDAGRTTLVRAAPKLVRENANVARQLVGGRLKKRPGSLRDVPAGEGRVLDLDGRRAAVFRGEDGRVSAVSATCTHMGCVVEWNTGDGTWDCPCHGSRFEVDGSVIEGPATRPLEPIDIPSATATEAEAGGVRS